MHRWMESCFLCDSASGELYWNLIRPAAEWIPGYFNISAMKAHLLLRVFAFMCKCVCTWVLICIISGALSSFGQNIDGHVPCNHAVCGCICVSYQFVIYRWFNACFASYPDVQGTLWHHQPTMLSFPWCTMAPLASYADALSLPFSVSGWRAKTHPPCILTWRIRSTLFCFNFAQNL